MWSDLKLKVKKDGGWVGLFSDVSCRPIEHHSHEQLGNANCFDNFIHVKIDPPWMLEDVNGTGIPFTWTNCFWNQIEMLNYLHICPGIADYKYHRSTSINIFLPKEPRQFLLPVGTPLVQLIPITERPIEVETKLVSYEEWVKIHNKFGGEISFQDKYTTIKKIAMAKEKGKCPFGFLHGKS